MYFCPLWVLVNKITLLYLLYYSVIQNNNYLYNISPRLCVCVFATFLALAKNAIGGASGEPGKARERIGAANLC